MTPRGKYGEHRHVAKQRGIPFLLTFEEWNAIWLASGKWEQRGSRRGQYVMARPGDQGAYEIGNVVICLAEDNRAERNRNYTMTGERNPAFGRNGKNHWLAMSEQSKAKHRLAVKGPRRSVLRARNSQGRFVSKEASLLIIGGACATINPV